VTRSRLPVSSSPAMLGSSTGSRECRCAQGVNENEKGQRKTGSIESVNLQAPFLHPLKEVAPARRSGMLRRLD
jgi:hypothetical protein